jgi:hypothetical protein
MQAKSLYAIPFDLNFNTQTMKRAILYILFLSLIYGQNAIAQEARRVTGVVTSADDSQPLPGVSVQVKGTNEGAVTNSTVRLN